MRRGNSRSEQFSSRSNRGVTVFRRLKPGLRPSVGALALQQKQGRPAHHHGLAAGSHPAAQLQSSPWPGCRAHPLSRALHQHLLVVSSCSWRGAAQPVQAFPPPRSRRPSRCHRLGFKMSTQKNQSCATGGNTYTGSYITAFAANHFILNEPNPFPTALVYLGVFICAFCKCICGVWQDWA